MSSGTIPMYADVISEKKLLSLVGPEMAALISALRADSHYVGYTDENPELSESDEFILGEAVREHLMWEGGPQRLDPPTHKAWKRLLSAFKKATGLKLYVGYYNDDDGGPYDDMDAVYWHVGGMYQLTEAGKKMKRFVTRKNFSQWG